MKNQDFILGEFESEEQKLRILKWFEEEELTFLPENTNLEEVAVLAKCFLSKTEARKNNCSGPIPPGFHKLGTKKRPFWVWKVGLPLLE